MDGPTDGQSDSKSRATGDDEVIGNAQFHGYLAKTT